MCILSEYLLSMLVERFIHVLKDLNCIRILYIYENVGYEMGRWMIRDRWWREYTLAAIDLVPMGQTPVAMDLVPVRNW